MPTSSYQLPIKLSSPVLHKLIDLQRIRGPVITPEMEHLDPVRKSDIPSKAAIIRSLIEEAHKREVENGKKART